MTSIKSNMFLLVIQKTREKIKLEVDIWVKKKFQTTKFPLHQLEKNIFAFLARLQHLSFFFPCVPIRNTENAGLDFLFHSCLSQI